MSETVITTTPEQDLERRALQLLRSLLEVDAGRREEMLTAEARGDVALRARVDVLLAVLDESDQYQPEQHAPLETMASVMECAGEVLGAYVLRERIGSGGMGDVYRAERADGAFEREVAIKRVRVPAQVLSSRFLRERQLLARLQHPHIAQLLDGGLDARQCPWLAMELVRGQSLIEWCDTRRASIQQRVDLLCQVCTAIDHAHRNLVVHRDIKPSNVMVDEAGDVKLLDFGIARLIAPDATESPTLALTPAWAAPEQLRGEPATTAADIYQLGLLMRALVLGLPRTTPLARMSKAWASLRKDHEAEARRVAGLRATGPEALGRMLRGDLDAIVALATADEPGSRYGSVGELLHDLRAWLVHRPVAARSHERGYRMRRALRRWWPALAATVAGIAMLGYHAVSLDRALQRTQVERNRAVAAEQDARRAGDNARYVSEHLVGMFAASSPDGRRGDTLSARQLLDNAEAAFVADPQAGQPPAASAMLWDALSRIHGGMGDDELALQAQARAVAAARQAGDPELLAGMLRTQAWAYFRHDQPERALRIAREGMRTLATAGKTHTVLYARIQNAAGFAAMGTGDTETGWREMEGSLALLERKGGDAVPLLSSALMNAVEAALTVGERKRAQNWLLQLSALNVAGADDDVVYKLQYGTRQARLGRMQDRLKESVDALAELSRNADGYFGAQHPESITYANEYGMALIASGQFAKAVEVLQRARLNAEAAMPEDHTLHHDTRGLLGIAELLQGRTDDAIKDLRAVIAWRQQKGQVELGQGPALERLALAGASCASGSPRGDTFATTPLDSARAEPWQLRLEARWRDLCVAQLAGRAALSGELSDMWSSGQRADAQHASRQEKEDAKK